MQHPFLFFSIMVFVAKKNILQSVRAVISVLMKNK